MKSEIHCHECGAIIDNDLLSADPQRRRFFAMLRDVWNNLPDDARMRFPSSETLRKHGLIAAGWCNVTTVVAGSKTVAPGVAAAFQAFDAYCIVKISGDVLTIYRAKSMGRRFLPRKEFHAVVTKFWDWVYQTTGIEADKSEAA